MLSAHGSSKEAVVNIYIRPAVEPAGDTFDGLLDHQDKSKVCASSGLHTLIAPRASMHQWYCAGTIRMARRTVTESSRRIASARGSTGSLQQSFRL